MSLAARKLIILESVDSTNNYAMAMVQKGVANAGDAVFAMEQTAGKAGEEKNGKAKEEKILLLSIPVQMQWLPVSQQFHLSVAVALACYDFFSKYFRKHKNKMAE